MTEEQQLLQIEQMCNAGAEAVVDRLLGVSVGPKMIEPVKWVVVSAYLPMMLQLGNRQNYNQPKADLACETLDFVRTVLSVPESMVPPRLKEMAENLLGRL